MTVGLEELLCDAGAFTVVLKQRRGVLRAVVGLENTDVPSRAIEKLLIEGSEDFEILLG